MSKAAKYCIEVDSYEGGTVVSITDPEECAMVNIKVEDLVAVSEELTNIATKALKDLAESLGYEVVE